MGPPLVLSELLNQSCDGVLEMDIIAAELGRRASILDATFLESEHDGSTSPNVRPSPQLHPARAKRQRRQATDVDVSTTERRPPKILVSGQEADISRRLAQQKQGGAARREQEEQHNHEHKQGGGSTQYRQPPAADSQHTHEGQPQPNEKQTSHPGEIERIALMDQVQQHKKTLALRVTEGAGGQVAAAARPLRARWTENESLQNKDLQPMPDCSMWERPGSSVEGSLEGVTSIVKAAAPAPAPCVCMVSPQVAMPEAAAAHKADTKLTSSEAGRLGLDDTTTAAVAPTAAKPSIADADHCRSAEGQSPPLALGGDCPSEGRGSSTVPDGLLHASASPAAGSPHTPTAGQCRSPSESGRRSPMSVEELARWLNTAAFEV
jgi:hypothetical protein